MTYWQICLFVCIRFISRFSYKPEAATSCCLSTSMALLGAFSLLPQKAQDLIISYVFACFTGGLLLGLAILESISWWMAVAAAGGLALIVFYLGLHSFMQHRAFVQRQKRLAELSITKAAQKVKLMNRSMKAWRQAQVSPEGFYDAEADDNDSVDKDRSMSGHSLGSTLRQQMASYRIANDPSAKSPSTTRGSNGTPVALDSPRSDDDVTFMNTQPLADADEDAEGMFKKKESGGLTMSTRRLDAMLTLRLKQETLRKQIQEVSSLKPYFGQPIQPS